MFNFPFTKRETFKTRWTADKINLTNDEEKQEEKNNWEY